MTAVINYIKEWNSIIESLGQGLQTILIRKYESPYNEFLFYPTYSYSMNENYLDSFKNNYKDFVQDNVTPKMQGKKIEVKYFAKCVNTIETPIKKIDLISDYFTWNNDHVKSYLKGKNPIIWILRIYELKNPYMAPPTPGAMRFAKIKPGLEIKNPKPVINDKDFSNLVSSLEEKLKY